MSYWVRLQWASACALVFLVLGAWALARPAAALASGPATPPAPDAAALVEPPPPLFFTPEKP